MEPHPQPNHEVEALKARSIAGDLALDHARTQQTNDAITWFFPEFFWIERVNEHLPKRQCTKNRLSIIGGQRLAELDLHSDRRVQIIDLIHLEWERER